MEKKTQGITVKKDENFNEWYDQVLLKAEICDKRLPNSRGFYGYPSWGTMILRDIECLFEKELMKRNHLPIRTPTVMPITLLEKEKEHATGFAPEVWKITEGRGGEKLEIPKVLRPTGEAVMYPYFSYWIQSYKDLPFKIFETRPSFRAEANNAVFPLLRSHEFYWIEAHTVQLDNEHADLQVKEDMEVFDLVVRQKLAIPFKLFKRPEWDKFAGADYTCAYDTPLPDGKVSQIGTTHNLGTHFAKAFDVMYVNEKNERVYAYQTSFGMGNGKIMGMIVAIHGDDKGLVLPPAISPIQIIIVPIYYDEEQREKVLEVAEKIKEKLHKYKVKIDKREDYTPGWKFNEWELKGVPLRIEIGPKDVQENKVVIVKRFDSEKLNVEVDSLNETFIESLFEEIAKKMYERASKLFKSDKAESFEEVVKKIESGVHIVEIPFCNSEECVSKLKEKTIKVRGIELFAHGEKTVKECEERATKEAKGKKCAICGNEAKEIVFVARQY